MKKPISAEKTPQEPELCPLYHSWLTPAPSCRLKPLVFGRCLRTKMLMWSPVLGRVRHRSIHGSCLFLLDFFFPVAVCEKLAAGREGRSTEGWCWSYHSSETPHPIRARSTWIWDRVLQGGFHSHSSMGVRKESFKISLRKPNTWGLLQGSTHESSRFVWKNASENKAARHSLVCMHMSGGVSKPSFTLFDGLSLQRPQDLHLRKPAPRQFHVPWAV